jgi:hypothetical protein
MEERNNLIMLKKKLVIKADWNDGDYVVETCTITDNQLIKLIPIFNKIKKYKSGNNWEDITNYLSEEEYELILNYVPSGPDSCDIHTIESIVVQEIISEKKYL